MTMHEPARERPSADTVRRALFPPIKSLVNRLAITGDHELELAVLGKDVVVSVHRPVSRSPHWTIRVMLPGEGGVTAGTPWRSGTPSTAEAALVAELTAFATSALLSADRRAHARALAVVAEPDALTFALREPIATQRLAWWLREQLACGTLAPGKRVPIGSARRKLGIEMRSYPDALAALRTAGLLRRSGKFHVVDQHTETVTEQAIRPATGR